MKKNKIFIALMLMLGIAYLASSCDPETYSLGKLPDKSEIKFEISQDFSVDPGGNTVNMTNLTDGVTLTWDYGTGRSNKKQETVQYAFKGDYTIKITAVTAGGLVELDPVTITVTDDNLNYVNDPLWTYLSGGVGNSKTWISDNGKYGLAKGPLAYADPSAEQEFENYTPNWEPEGNPPESTDENVGYGSTMTFSLDGGPFMTTHKLNEGGIDESGTYFLDADNKTLTTIDATILRPDNYKDNASNWNNELKILELNENQLRIAVMRTNDEGPWIYILNYVSKDYADNYVPEDVPDPNPPINLDGGTVDDLLSTTTTTTKTWYLSPDSPFDWTDLEGNLLNGWQTVADYEAAGWPGYTSADQETVVNNKITFSSDGSVTTIDSNGTEMAGSYSTSSDGTNIITFADITPYFPIGSSWATVGTTSQNQWKIVKTAKTGSIVTDIWFGKRDESGKSEYMVFHFVLDDNVAGGEDPGTAVEFDNSKFVFGDLEGNGNFRLEFFNEFGSTVTDPPINTGDIAFGGSMSITFTLSGIVLKDGASGSYTADYQFASNGWGFGYWGEGTKNSGDTTITGDGTYTLTFTPGTDVSGPIVFVIDIFGLGGDIEDLTAVTATIDSIIIN